MARQFDPVQLIKAALWEEAVGKLRAMIAVQGACTGELEKYEKLKDEVEGFIKHIEDREYNL